MLRSVRVLTCGLLALVAVSSSAYARESGVQASKDGKRILINKDVGNERWAITFNLDDNTVTGNVFHADGGAPSFIWCQQTSSDGQNVGASCFGADRCDVGPCTPSMWTFIANVTLPASFFAEPSGPQPTPQPTPNDSLSALIGTWDFTFTIISTFTDTYRLQQIQTTQSGTRGLVGLNEFGDTVATFRVQELEPGTSVPFEFILVDEEQGSLCEFHFFDRTGATAVSGETFLTGVDGTGSCDPNSLGSPHAMTGVRTSTTSALSAAERLGRRLDDVKAARRASIATELNALGDAPSTDDAITGAIRAALGAMR